ncbi:unnamed protein product [Protopolystoma xenopodis]|uniref:Uncharacterized protein n=1 Tax=Protopolystoma xenopodis TaxID=117903 RepID=A0A448WWV1_9PLAT|nr:unnamed protein product [Protopolystoma xenopodis]
MPVLPLLPFPAFLLTTQSGPAGRIFFRPSGHFQRHLEGPATIYTLRLCWHSLQYPKKRGHKQIAETTTLERIPEEAGVVVPLAHLMITVWGQCKLTLYILDESGFQGHRICLNAHENPRKDRLWPRGIFCSSMSPSGTRSQRFALQGWTYCRRIRCDARLHQTHEIDRACRTDQTYLGSSMLGQSPARARVDAEIWVLLRLITSRNRGSKTHDFWASETGQLAKMYICSSS